MVDRRSGRDRRKKPRYKTNIEIEWEGLVGRKAGIISDFNRTGCFVLCSGEAEDGDVITIFFPLTNGNTVRLLGEVVNHVFEIGFALKFVELTETQKEFLKVFEETLPDEI